MKKFIVLIIAITTMALAWVLPDLYKIVTDEAPEYPLSFYSSVSNKFCSFKFTDKGLIRTDVDDKIYTQKQFDSLLPMVYTNQLIYDRRMPKSINGVDVNIQKIRMSNFAYRYKPQAYQKPSIKLYPLFESMSDRVDLAAPGDVFRLTDAVEFIDIQQNRIKAEKSTSYNKLLFNSGFIGPAKRVAGIPTTRKNYDEGYFIIDNTNALFHMKRVNGKPFIRNVNIDKSIRVEYFEATDYPNKDFYGFLFDTVGQMYILTTDNYKLVKIGIPPINLTNTTVSIRANMFYWNIHVKTKSSKISYAVDANTKTYVDSIESLNGNNHSYWIENILPFSINLKSRNDGYIKCRISNNFPIAFFFNIFFVLVYLLIFRKSKLENNIIVSLWVCITGIYGFIACILFKSDINK